MLPGQPWGNVLNSSATPRSEKFCKSSTLEAKPDKKSRCFDFHAEGRRALLALLSPETAKGAQIPATWKLVVPFATTPTSRCGNTSPVAPPRQFSLNPTHLHPLLTTH